jgi:hypothetical protein
MAEGPTSPAFVVVLSTIDGKPRVTYFKKLGESHVALQLVSRCVHGFDGVTLAYALRGDYAEWLVWDGQQFKTVRQCMN